VKENNHTR